MEDKLFFAATVALVAVSIFGCVIKWFFRPIAYKEYYEILFPGQFYVGLLYLMQVFEILYLFDMADPQMLRYTNAFTMLLSPPLMIMICRRYFFPKKVSRVKESYMFVPAAIILLVFLLRAFDVIAITAQGRDILICLSLAMFMWFYVLTVRMALDIGKAENSVDKMEHSDEVDFRRTFASYMQWLPTILCTIVMVNFICNNQWVKFACDIISTIATICFVMFTLDPWREVEFSQEQHIADDALLASEQKSKRRMSDSRYEQLRDNLLKLFDEKQIYLTPHLSLDMLLKELSTNRNYLCETIARSGFKSFYDMVNTYRVKYAIGLIKSEPQAKMADISFRSGFASAASMNKAFTQQGMPTPSKHREGGEDQD